MTQVDEIKKFQKDIGDTKPISDISGWLARMNRNKQKLRELLGGVKLTMSFEGSKKVPDATARQIERDVKEIVGSHVAISSAHIAINSVPVGSRSLSVTKFLAGLKTRNKLDVDKCSRLDRLISEYGKIYAHLKPLEFLTLDTSPQAFLRAGGYIGETRTSCLCAPHGENIDKRYALAEHDKTLVAYVHAEEEFDFLKTYIAFRMFMFIDIGKNRVDGINPRFVSPCDPIKYFKGLSIKGVKFGLNEVPYKHLILKGGMNYTDYQQYSSCKSRVSYTLTSRYSIELKNYDGFCDCPRESFVLD